MIIFLYGKDTFRSRQQLKKMVEKFKKDRDPAGYNTIAIDASVNKDEKIVMENILAIPFLAERRMVVVENLLASKNSKLQAELLERIKENRIPESTVLVFWEGLEDFKGKEIKKMAEILAAEKFAQKFDLQTGVSLEGWIRSEVGNRGSEIEGAAASFLAQNSGADMWRINSLLDQLVAYSGSEQICLAAVKLFLTEKASDNIFELVESAVRGDLRKVYIELKAQYDKGEDVQFVFAMLLRQIRILLELRDAFERESNITTDVAAKKLGIHPFVAKKSWGLIKNLNLEKIKKMYSDLLDLDISLKTGSMDAKVLLDIYLAKTAALVNSR